eukprot:3807593-Lingulodinium_polyedra.AAC.1
MEERPRMNRAMADEWAKWLAFEAVRPCPPHELRRHLAAGARVVGTRWVLTRKPDASLKARLVVQGCQER